jgi:PKD repeat protein
MKNIYLGIPTALCLLIGSTLVSGQNVYIPDPVFKSNLVADVSINTNMDSQIQISEAVAFTGTISCVETGIYDVTGIEEFINVTGIQLSDNNISNMDLSSNPLLTYLSCSNNWLTSLNLTNNPLLQQVYVGSNYLTTIDISGLDSLTDFDCSSNNLSTLDLSNNALLSYVSCGSNNLTSLDIPPSVTNLYCGYNQITSLDFSSNPNIVNLGVSGNPFTCLDVSGLPNLQSLDCTSMPQLQDLNVQNGNNSNFIGFYVYNNPNLFCIQVDTVSYSTSYWSNIDSWMSFSLSCGTPPSAYFNSSAPSCFGSPVVFMDNSWPVNSWFWDFGDGYTSTLQNPLHTYSTPGNYNVTLVSGNCYGSDTATTVVVQGVDIHGHVSYTGGNVTNGVAIIYPYEPYYISFDTVQITNLTPAGDYHFSNIPQGDYLIKVFADSLTYPTCVPTYSYSDWAWDSAVVVFHGCTFNDTTDVVMQEVTGGTPGIGVLHGTIVEGVGFGRAQGDPVHGVDVKLGVTGQNHIVASTTTDALGQYTFNNLGFANYTVYADIPGLERDSSYQITLDAVNNQFLNLNYIVDSVSIDILENIGIEEQGSNVYEMNVFPNPTKDLTSLTYTINQNTNVTIEMINVLGVKVQTLFNGHQSSGQYNCSFNPKNSSLKAGIYFISLTANNKTETIRIVILD